MRVLAWCVLGVVACGSSDGPRGGDGSVDTAGGDGPASRCDRSKPFGAPSLVAGVNSLSADQWGWMTSDELTIYYAHAEIGSSDFNVFSATRGSPNDAFSGAASVAGVNTSVTADNRPTLTADGLIMFMEVNADLFVATRANLSLPFSAPVPVDGLNTTTNFENNPWVSPDGLALLFVSDVSGVSDLYRSSRPSIASQFASPTPIDELNTPSLAEFAPVVTKDGLEIYFARFNPVNQIVTADIMHATRSSLADGFGAPTVIGELSSTTTEEVPTWISDDSCEIMFTSGNLSGGAGGLDVWIAKRPL